MTCTSKQCIFICVSAETRRCTRLPHGRECSRWIDEVEPGICTLNVRVTGCSAFVLSRISSNFRLWKNGTCRTACRDEWRVTEFWCDASVGLVSGRAWDSNFYLNHHRMFPLCLEHRISVVWRPKTFPLASKQVSWTTLGVGEFNRDVTPWSVPDRNHRTAFCQLCSTVAMIPLNVEKCMPSRQGT